MSPSRVFSVAIPSGEAGHINLVNRVQELPGLTGDVLKGLSCFSLLS